MPTMFDFCSTIINILWPGQSRMRVDGSWQSQIVMHRGHFKLHNENIKE